MGLFFHVDPVKKRQQQIDYYSKQIDKFYTTVLFRRQQLFFTERQILQFIGFNKIKDSQKAEIVNLLRMLLVDEIFADHLYLTFALFCPNCQRLIVMGSVLPHNEGRQLSYDFRIGQVALSKLDFVCPYCALELPKEQQEQQITNFLYHLTPNFIQWYNEQQQT